MRGTNLEGRQGSWEAWSPKPAQTIPVTTVSASQLAEPVECLPDTTTLRFFLFFHSRPLRRAPRIGVLQTGALHLCLFHFAASTHRRCQLGIAAVIAFWVWPAQP